MKSCIRRLALSLLGAVAVSVFLCGTSWAQENAELTGTVKDPSGAVVPNAKVTLTNASTAEVRAGTTNAAGLYDFPALHNGTYDLKVAATGFEAYAKTGIVMDVAATVREDAVLALGSSTTTVTVQANTLHLQTETNDVSNLITAQQITELATNGRSITSLTTLGTGVSSNLPAFNGVAAQGSSSSVSFNGMRPGHNNWLLDGGEVDAGDRDVGADHRLEIVLAGQAQQVAAGLTGTAAPQSPGRAMLAPRVLEVPLALDQVAHPHVDAEPAAVLAGAR